MIMAMFETVCIDGVDYRHESPADCARSAICALLNGESGSVSVSIEVDLHPVLFGEMIKAGHLSAFRNSDDYSVSALTGVAIGKRWRGNRSDDEARREPECRIQGIVARQVPRRVKT